MFVTVISINDCVDFKMQLSLSTFYLPLLGCVLSERWQVILQSSPGVVLITAVSHGKDIAVSRKHRLPWANVTVAGDCLTSTPVIKSHGKLKSFFLIMQKMNA